jgi:hypothetical protein
MASLTPLRNSPHPSHFNHPLVHLFICASVSDFFGLRNLTLTHYLHIAENTGLRDTVAIYTDTSRALYNLFEFTDTLESAAPEDPKRAYVVDTYWQGVWKSLSVRQSDSCRNLEAPVYSPSCSRR